MRTYVPSCTNVCVRYYDLSKTVCGNVETIYERIKITINRRWCKEEWKSKVIRYIHMILSPGWHSSYESFTSTDQQDFLSPTSVFAVFQVPCHLYQSTHTDLSPRIKGLVLSCPHLTLARTFQAPHPCSLHKVSRASRSGEFAWRHPAARIVRLGSNTMDFCHPAMVVCPFPIPGVWSGTVFSRFCVGVSQGVWGAVRIGYWKPSIEWGLYLSCGSSEDLFSPLNLPMMPQWIVTEWSHIKSNLSSINLNVSHCL